MQWEYLEVRFALEFDSTQFKILEKTRKSFGLTQTYNIIETPEEISWDLLAIIDAKKEIILSGKAIKQRQTEGAYYFRVSNIKSPCFQYINKIGTEGWEWFGNMPTRFVEKYGELVYVDLTIRSSGAPDISPGDSYSIGSGATWFPHYIGNYVIDIFGDSFFFKRGK